MINRRSAPGLIVTKGKNLGSSVLYLAFLPPLGYVLNVLLFSS